MTTVVDRPVVGSVAPEYRRSFASAKLTVAVGGGLIAVWALLALAFISVTIGVIGLAIAAAVIAIDVVFTTPLHMVVDRDGVTLLYFRRTRTFGAKALVVTHDLPRGRLSIARRGSKRTIVRFSDDGNNDAVDAFVVAGVEVVSR
jgi:hypothetical protein